MELDDSWYSSKQIYSINYRSLRPGSNLVVETIRFNPSACTCGKQCSEPHYRVESRVINKAERVDIKESVKIGDDSHTAANEMEHKSAITGSLTSGEVSGDGKREASVENERSLKSDVGDTDVTIIDMKCVDKVTGIGDSVKYDVEIEEIRNDVKFEAGCEFVNKSVNEDRDVKNIDMKCVDEVIVIGDSVKVDGEVECEFRNDVKFDAECEFDNANKTNSIDDITGNDISVKNGSVDGYFNVSTCKGKIRDDVTRINSNVKNVFETGHFSISYVEIKDDITENDNSVKNGTEVGEVNVSKMNYNNEVTEHIGGMKQDSDNCEVVSSSGKNDVVVSASRSCIDQNDDHSIDVLDDATVTGEIFRGQTNADGRCLDVENEGIVHENTTEFVEEISAAFGIMSVYCNSALHCSR